KGAASRMGLRVSSHASWGLPPSLTSLVWTSARLTVLQVASLNSSGVSVSEPGSLLSNASTAEASSTTLLMFGCLAAFGNEFAGQRPAGPYVPLDALLRALDTPFEGRDPQ